MIWIAIGVLAITVVAAILVESARGPLVTDPTVCLSRLDRWDGVADTRAGVLDRRKFEEYDSSMSRPSEREIEQLRVVAYEIVETVEFKVHKITSGLALDAAFRDGRAVASELERAIILRAAEKASSQVGVHAERVPRGVELFTSDGDVKRKYRIKKARRDAEGRAVMVCGSDSTLLRCGDEPEGLFSTTAENWVLGFILGADHTVVDLFIGEIVDWTGESIVQLVLDPVISLMPTPSTPGFISDDEDDLGLDDDEREAGDSDVA